MAEKKKKKAFQMPHLLLIVLGIMMIMSILTYIVPAGQFATDPETGKLIGSEFHYLGYQTPISPWQALLCIKDGITNSGAIIASLLFTGGLTQVVLDSKALDNLVDQAVYKLKDKGIDILLPALTAVFFVYGTFAGGDYLIAMIPIGLMIAKKLRVDPPVGFFLVICDVLIAWTSSPVHVLLAQMTMNVPAYSGFGMRTILQIPILLFSMWWIWRYAKKVAKNPESSILGKSEWYDELEDNTEIQIESHYRKRDVVIALLYIAEPITVVIMQSYFGYGYEVFPAVCLIYLFVIGLIHGYSMNEISQKFAKGASTMAFVSVLIGTANAMSQVMTKGNIMHTIVYTACLPLRSLNAGWAAIGIFIVVSLINMLIPSASAKTAILCPIIQPMCEALSIPMQIGVTAFKYGDAVTNMITPIGGTVIASLDLTPIPFNKYFKWILPFTAAIYVYCAITLYFLGSIGWTGL